MASKRNLQSTKPTFNSLEEQLQFDAKPISYSPENGKVVGKHQGAVLPLVSEKG